MAQEKKTTKAKKPTSKKAAPKATGTAKAAPAPVKDLHGLRITADEADKRVQDAIRLVSRAKADQSDFAVRRRNIDAANAKLQTARLDAMDARSAFEAAKKEQKT